MYVVFLLGCWFTEPFLNKVRKVCWSGIPRDLRPQIWKLLLGIVPAHVDRRSATLARKHGEYFELLPEFHKVVFGCFLFFVV
jgi:hypothetical protein